MLNKTFLVFAFDNVACERDESRFAASKLGPWNRWYCAMPISTLFRQGIMSLICSIIGFLNKSSHPFWLEDRAAR